MDGALEQIVTTLDQLRFGLDVSLAEHDTTDHRCVSWAVFFGFVSVESEVVLFDRKLKFSLNVRRQLDG